MVFPAKRPHLFLWISIPFVLAIGFLSEGPLAININDTTRVIASHQIGIGVGTYFAVLALLYWAVINRRKKLNSWLTLIHLGSTIDLLFLIWLIHLWCEAGDKSLQSCLNYRFFQILVVIFCLGQFLFLINVIGSYLTNSYKNYSNGHKEE